MQLTLSGLIVASAVLATPLAIPAGLSFDLKAPKAVKRAFDHLDAEPIPLFAPVPAKQKRQIDYSQFVAPNTDSYGLSWCPATQQRYPPGVYTCYETQLCKIGFLACGRACYSPTMYGCSNGQLTQGASNGAAAAAAPATPATPASPQVSGIVAASRVSGVAVVAAQAAQVSGPARLKRHPIAAAPAVLKRYAAPEPEALPAPVPVAEAPAQQVGGWLFG